MILSDGGSLWTTTKVCRYRWGHKSDVTLISRPIAYVERRSFSKATARKLERKESRSRWNLICLDIYNEDSLLSTRRGRWKRMVSCLDAPYDGGPSFCPGTRKLDAAIPAAVILIRVETRFARHFAIPSQRRRSWSRLQWKLVYLFLLPQKNIS